jgi:hypothetical protein
MTVRRLVSGLVTVISAVVIAVASPVAGQTQKESFTGFAINMNDGPNTATVDFTIERWSTEAERGRLLSILKEVKDPNRANQQLLKTLQSLPQVGDIRTQRTLAWDLRYAHQSPLENGGRRIVLATDRPVGFRETANQARTLDYPFTILEIQLDKSNQGVGKILAGTRILVDKNNALVLENYGQQPVRFNNIRPLK